MRQVQLATRLRYNLPRLLIRKPPFRIVFHHIPKCGGTSIIYAIRRSFPLRFANTVRIRSEASARPAQLTGRSVHAVREDILLYYMAMPQVAYIAGHVPFSEAAYQEYGDEWRFLSIIRHPVSRWISEYFFNRSRPPGTYASLDVELNEYLESAEGKALGTTYIKYFTELTSESPTVDRALHVARRFAIIGAVEDLPAFAKAFENRLERRLIIPHVNRNPVSSHRQSDKVTPELWRRIEDVCRPDIEFYESILADAVRR